MRILVVDDDSSVVQALVSLLKGVSGYEVRAALSGEKALEHAAALGGVDLLITDVVMEPINGFALHDELASRYPGVRTIFISGFDLSDYEEQTRGHQVLAKPIDSEVLLAAIEKVRATIIPRPTAPSLTAAAQRTIAQPRAVGAPRVRATPRVVTGSQEPTAVPRVVEVPIARAVPMPDGMPESVEEPSIETFAGVNERGEENAEWSSGSPEGATDTLEADQTITAGSASDEFPDTSFEAAEAADLELVTASAGGEIEPPVETVDDDEARALEGQAIGTHEIKRLIGRTAWGPVYAAVQSSINRSVGLQLLDPSIARDDTIKDRFIADARAKANVQHPTVLSVYEAGESEGHIFFTHEYVDGRTLGQMQRSGEKIDEPTALKVLRVAGEGLAYFGMRHIPHTPLDAQSIYVSTDGQPRLANLATQTSDHQLGTEDEIRVLGRTLLSVLPAIQQVSPGLRALLGRMVQTGPQTINAWGSLLQGVKALEPKVVPLEAAKISAQDRAAMAAIEDVRKRQKRSLIMNLSLMGACLAFALWLVFHFLISNERTLDEQVTIPAGEFLFGAGETVNLDEFQIDKYEVTYGQYAQFLEFLKNHPTTEYDHQAQPRIKAAEMHKPPSWDTFYGFAKLGRSVHSVPIDLNCPVMEVDWWDAYAYAKWRGRALPTERQWEKAARGTKGFIYPWGDEFDSKKVNSNADYNGKDPAAKGKIDGFNFWNPVDKIKGDKSPFGAIGMAGNVSEWVGDWAASTKNPVLKGGSYLSPDVRLDRRVDNLKFETISESIGFRTVNQSLAPK